MTFLFGAWHNVFVRALCLNTVRASGAWMFCVSPVSFRKAFRQSLERENGILYMKYFHIGAMADSFRLPPEEALKKVREVGAEGYQIYASEGQFSAENLSRSKRREFKEYSDGLGLKISALCGDFGKGFYDREQNRTLVERSKRVLELASDL